MSEPAMLGFAKKPKWVEPFVTAVGGRMATQEEILANTATPMVTSGISKSLAKTQALKHGLDWWYVDTGYFGNHQDKVWFRISLNEHQNTKPIAARPNNRLQRLAFDRTHYHRGKNILIVPPDAKVCSGYHLPDPDVWIQQTVETIRSYTDRPIEIRQRPASRQIRVYTDTFAHALQRDVNCVVVWTSNCGVEAAIHGIPVVSLGPSAATQLSQPVEQIDDLEDLCQDHVESWLRHLSYNQFSMAEMRSGRAWEMLHS